MPYRLEGSSWRFLTSSELKQNKSRKEVKIGNEVTTEGKRQAGTEITAGREVTSGKRRRWETSFSLKSFVPSSFLVHFGEIDVRLKMIEYKQI